MTTLRASSLACVLAAVATACTAFDLTNDVEDGYGHHPDASGGDGDQETPQYDASAGDGPSHGDGDAITPPPVTQMDPEAGRLKGIARAHNEARARVDTATPLPALLWSTELAQTAQAYADQLAARCSGLAHSASPYGENLAWFGGTPGSAASTVSMWESEKQCYTYGPFSSGVGTATCTSACASSGGCGHYTQVVWRKTTRLGCGVADCTSGSYRGTFWVCNYDPPGNYRDQYPY